MSIDGPDFNTERIPEDESVVLYAHTPSPDSDQFHLLVCHLRAVAEKAAEFASKFDAALIGRVLGLAHDLGKASPDFQKYLLECFRGIPNPRKSPHSDPSAAAMASKLGPFIVCVEGHHGGMPEMQCANTRLRDAPPANVEAARNLGDKLGIEAISQHRAMRPPRSAEHLVRMCFSALVDADYLDTERHFSSQTQRGHYPTISQYREMLEAELARYRNPVGVVNQVRCEVQVACRVAAEQDPGFFRLTVPTGGGKTLASLLFALLHAERLGLDRVIVAIPFTSIIEQTVDTYRQIFGFENVLEHHSAVAVTDEDGQQAEQVRLRLAAENWDCPLVVTTNVQLFESLLANKPSKCRKLHNIARSVIVLDEAQSLPPSHIQSTTEVLGWMVDYARCSVVFCTATQPDYAGIPDVPSALTEAREIVPEPKRLFDRLKRVGFTYQGNWTHDDVANRMAGVDQVLAVLNTKADSAKVLAALSGDALYLSTWLCPHHRRKVLAEVKRRLDEGLACRLVSTQVVEAGVDVDFPLVLRAMAPLDSLVQAAGRCNRNGRLSELGICEVFDLAGGGSPKGSYRSAIDTTRRFIPARLDEVGTPELQGEFTRAYFGIVGTDVIDSKKNIRLQKLREELNYPLVAQYSTLIDEETVSVVIHSYAPDEVEALLRSLAFGKSPRLVARMLGPYSVSLRPLELAKAMREGLVEMHDSGFHLWKGPYDAQVGIGRGAIFEPEELMA